MVYVLIFLVAFLFTYNDVLCKASVGRRMRRLRYRWFWITLSAVIWTSCDVLARAWGLKGPWALHALAVIAVIAPVGCLVFGLVCRDAGLAIGSAIGNAMNAFASLAIGLLGFDEWKGVSAPQFVGIGAAAVGILLMLFCEPHREEEEAVERSVAGWMTQRRARFQILFMPLIAYLIFGGVVAQLGLAIGSGVMNAVNLIATVLLGLIRLREWEALSRWQGVGIASAVAGVLLMLFG